MGRVRERTGPGEQGPGDLARARRGQGRAGRTRRPKKRAQPWDCVGREAEARGGSHTAEAWKLEPKGREEAGG